jgi:hypothetical protein
MSDDNDPGLPEEAREMSRRSRIYHVLLVLLFLLMALQPYAYVADGLLVQLGFAGLLLAGLAAVASRRRLLVIGLVLGVPAVALLFVPGGISTVSGGILAIATLVFICFMILRRMFQHPVVTSGTVSAALVVYLIFGVIWARAYWLVEHLRPGSFTGLSGTGGVVLQRDLFYYSYVTLSTLGYGDIGPVSAVARSLAITEATIGQLYLVVMVAGLVGLSLSERQARRQE